MNTGFLCTGTMGRNHVRNYSNMKKVGSVRVFDINAVAVREVEPLNRELQVSVDCARQKRPSLSPGAGGREPYNLQADRSVLLDRLHGSRSGR